MRFDLRHGDSRDELKLLGSAHVDALVTDPPAGISFMGKSWDGAAAFRAQMRPIFAECLRVLKPGAHGLVWALPRTSHWTATALEDAGFEIRDRVSHLFGTGFPKSLDVSKAIDKAAGAEPKVVGAYVNPGGTRPMTTFRGWDSADRRQPMLTAPATDAAKQWEGWGTALKPACEDWWLVRKPLEGTVAETVLAHGTGALNIDGCRIGTGADKGEWPLTGRADERGSMAGPMRAIETDRSSGRWPANVTLSHNDDCERVGTKRVRASLPASGPTVTGGSSSRARGLFAGTAAAPANHADADGLETVEAWRCTLGCAAALLDEQSGESAGVATAQDSGRYKGEPNSYGAGGYYGGRHPGNSYSDTGGASRFFYVAKPDRAERDIGCEDLAPASGGEATARVDGTAGLQNPRAGAGRNGGARNIHPTVKSVDLMRWLCRLITPKGGLVLDPFMGSGSTGVACSREGLRFIGIERERQYFEIARRRVVGDAPLFNRAVLK